jgi:hypothetical protein
MGDTDTLANIDTGNWLAQQINDDLFVPADVSLEVRMHAISSLLAGTAVAFGADWEGANEIFNGMVATAKASLQSGYFLARKNWK